MTTTDEEDERRRGWRKASQRRIVPEVVESTEEVWGELPSMATVEMHDMIASVINSTDSTDEQAGMERPLENRIFAGGDEPRKAKQSRKNPPATSPFYSALKTILATPIEEEDQEKGEEEEEKESDDDSGVYSVLSRQLRDSVILILTHCGFSDASNECLEVLTDLLHHYLRQFATLLRTTADDQDLYSGVAAGSTDFVDTVSKVLAQMGVPDLDALRQYNDQLVELDRKLKEKIELEEKERQEELRKEEKRIAKRKAEEEKEEEEERKKYQVTPGKWMEEYAAAKQSKQSKQSADSEEPSSPPQQESSSSLEDSPPRSSSTTPL